MTLNIPLKTVSEANAHTHWRLRQQRAKEQRAHVLTHLLVNRETMPRFPVRVTFTRLGTRTLDSDNLAGAFKHVRDTVAAFFRVDDGDERWGWVYQQEKAKEVGIRITIEPKG